MTLPPLGAAPHAAHPSGGGALPIGPRVAWFSPMPPSSSGIAAYAAELLPHLAARGLRVDVFAEAPASGGACRRHRRPRIRLDASPPVPTT